jgi:putative flippase GtrA
MALHGPIFFRYLLVGVLATAAHYAILTALVEIGGAAAPASAAAGASVGALVAYAVNRGFTFRGSAPHARAMPRFLLIAALGAAANGSIVWFGTALMNTHYLVAQATATGIVAWTGFTLNRRWAFA